MTKSLMGKKRRGHLSRPFAISMIAVFLPALVMAADEMCPPRAPNVFTALTVVTHGSANAAGGQLAKSGKALCWQTTPSLSDQQQLRSDGPGGHVSADYSYEVSLRNISVSSHLAANGSKKNASAGGEVQVLVEWFDQLTFHSNKVKPIQKGPDGKPIVTKDSYFSVEVKLSGTPTCQHSGPFQVLGRWAVYADYEQSKALEYLIVAGTDPPISFQSKLAQSGDICGGFLYPWSFDLINDSKVELRGLTSVVLLGDVNSKQPSGNASGGVSGMSVCLVHPTQPDDVTVTSLSGTNYWCTN